jgi:hypothetical protein
MNQITDQFIAQIKSLAFRNAAEINLFFQNNSGQDFIGWFQKKVAKQGEWADLGIVNPAQASQNFTLIWDEIETIFGLASINLIQFVTLMSVIIHETGGLVSPIAERFGTSSHPGIAYLFDKIAGLKQSYNTASGNRTAFALFNDPVYIGEHQALALGSQLAQTTDARWKGEAYPSGFPTTANLATTGFILQADFFKFRGRGLIQTTHRVNYKDLILFVQQAPQTQQTLVNFQQRWKGLDLDTVATRSTFSDWDTLFQQTEFIIPCEAISRHNQKSGNYLQLPLTAAQLNGTAPGSIFNVGKRINGGTAYANRLSRRVLQLLTVLNL